jgi:hypothetical protein
MIIQGLTLNGGFQLDPPPPGDTGYVVGGNYRQNGSQKLDTIDNFSFLTDGDAATIGNLAETTYNAASASSSLSGYTMGGKTNNIFAGSIQKFSFNSTATTGTTVGNLTQATQMGTGNQSSEYGYASGGWISNQSGSANIINKFPFASDTNAVNIGQLAQGQANGAECGHSSSENGYVVGGQGGTSSTSKSNRIEKFPFSSDTNASYTADLVIKTFGYCGVSNNTHGFVCGGAGGIPYPATNRLSDIQRFPFASDSNASLVGDLSEETNDSTGVSGTDSGYSCSGTTPSYNLSSFRITKFPYASVNTNTFVGNLPSATEGASGCQG